jgi:hypothetical protein
MTATNGTAVKPWSTRQWRDLAKILQTEAEAFEAEAERLRQRAARALEARDLCLEAADQRAGGRRRTRRGDQM